MSSPSLPLLRLGPDGHLNVISPNHPPNAVRVARCFPWTEPNRFFSLRDVNGHEVAFVQNPEDLDSESQTALNRALTLTSFVFVVRRIISIEQDIELRVWQVETDRGPRRFQTELDQWPEPVTGGGWLLRDITGDLYRFPSLEAMDRQSRRLFWAFLD